MPPGPIRPIPALSAPTHPREGLLGVEVGLAPRLRGLLQLLPPPPLFRCRALSPSRCSAGFHRRAEHGRRRAVPGLGVCCPAAPGPPPRRGRLFSTADSSQPARSERSQAETPLRPPVGQPERSRGAARRVLIPPASSPPTLGGHLCPPGPAPRAKGAPRDHPTVPGVLDAPLPAPSRAGISSPPAQQSRQRLALRGGTRAGGGKRSSAS